MKAIWLSALTGASPVVKDQRLGRGRLAVGPLGRSGAIVTV